MTKVWIVEGINPRVPGQPRIVCATEAKAREEASALTAMLCEDYDIPRPDHPSHWEQALNDVQDRIIAENEMADTFFDILDPEERAEATGADVWITETEVEE